MVYVVLLQMAAHGRRRRSWTLLSLPTSSKAWHPALIIIYASPTATSPSGKLTSRQTEQVRQALCLHSSSLLSSSRLSPLGFHTAKYKARVLQRVSCSSRRCLWSAFKDFCERRAWLAIWNDPLLVFVSVNRHPVRIHHALSLLL